jgi:glutamate-1-semialdehyde 2,1-aminomutase
MPSLYERAAIISGRSLTRSKSPDRLIWEWATTASGASIWTTDGNEYIDMVCGLGAISLGYKERHVSCLDPKGYLGGVFSLPHVLEVEAGEAVLKHVAPWASSVRFFKTGSEATHAAYRVAKAATGRGLIGMASDAYHGWHEWCSEGSITRLLYGDGFPANLPLAAVFYEPPRFDPPDVEKLQRLRDYCDRTGALLVIDEMIWGGRWALGGATEYFGIIPDLACYGKAMANGEAVAFVVGRDALRDHGEVASGTFSGCTTGLQAVVDTLHTYTTEPVIDTLWERALHLHGAFSEAVPATFCTLTGPAPLMGLRFANPGHRVPFKDAMAARGVLIYPDWMMVNYSHTTMLLERVAEAAGEACRAVA